MRCYSRRDGADLTDGADSKNRLTSCSLAFALLFALFEALAC